MLHHGEKFNSITHAFGAVLALLGAITLVTLGARLGDPWKVVSFAIYGSSLFGLYLCSTLYHSTQGKRKAVLQKWDHCAIYLLIAGSYTPFSLVSLRTGWGPWLCLVIWALALFGMAQELWLQSGGRRLSLVIYILMGWLAIAAVLPLLDAIGWPGFLWLVAGGVLYTGGTVFYVLDERLRHSHGVWHLFVLGGSTCHFVAVAGYVL